MVRHPLLTTLKEFNRECDKDYYKIKKEKKRLIINIKKNNFVINIL